MINHDHNLDNSEQNVEPDRVIFLFKKGCAYCESATRDFKEQIDKGMIEVVYAEEPKGKEILEHISITKVPACLIFRALDKKYDYCTEEEKNVQTRSQSLQTQQTQVSP